MKANAGRDRPCFDPAGLVLRSIKYRQIEQKRPRKPFRGLMHNETPQKASVTYGNIFEADLDYAAKPGFITPISRMFLCRQDRVIDLCNTIFPEVARDFLLPATKDKPSQFQV